MRLALPKQVELLGKLFGLQVPDAPDPIALAHVGVVRLNMRAKATTQRYLNRLCLDPDRLREAVEVFESRGPGKVIPFGQKVTPEVAGSGGEERDQRGVPGEWK